MFVVNGKLISLDVHNTASVNEEFDNLALEIEAYPELKESLQRFLDNPDMERYGVKVWTKKVTGIYFSVYFTEGFNKCLDQIQSSKQGGDGLEWWFTKEGNMIDEIDHLLSSFLMQEKG